MTTVPFDNLIDRQEAIDRLKKGQPVYAIFKGNEQEAVATIFGDEVLTLESVRSLSDVVLFSSELVNLESYPLDFNDGQMVTTIP
jgi:hypothetical protein